MRIKNKWEEDLEKQHYLDTWLIEFIENLLLAQRKEIGREFKKWFYGDTELIEEAIERITGVRVELLKKIK